MRIELQNSLEHIWQSERERVILLWWYILCQTRCYCKIQVKSHKLFQFPLEIVYCWSVVDTWLFLPVSPSQHGDTCAVYHVLQLSNDKKSWNSWELSSSNVLQLLRLLIYLTDNSQLGCNIDVNALFVKWTNKWFRGAIVNHWNQNIFILVMVAGSWVQEVNGKNCVTTDST